MMTIPTVETDQTSESAREAAAGLLDALGWRFARDGKKALPSERFNVLGVCMDLSQSVNDRNFHFTGCLFAWSAKFCTRPVSWFPEFA